MSNKLKFVIVTNVLISLLAAGANASCERERAQRDEWKSRFESLKDGCNAGGVVSSILAGICLPVGLAALCATGAAGAAAQNAERIYHEKENNLKNSRNKSHEIT